jgi:type II secretory pathway predicted ATPase ExeA
MTAREPYPFADFTQIRDRLLAALADPDEIYMLLTGDTGTGKSAVMHALQDTLDRRHYRIVYFAHARRLSAPGLIRVLSNALRLTPKRSHPETVQDLARHLADEASQLLLLLDEAHELAPDALDEARTLAESDLAGARPIRILLAGLPPLRERLQGIPALWRRIGVREEITGLMLEEVPSFLEHHFGTALTKRLCPEGMRILFERGRGAPGVMLPMYRSVLREAPDKGRIEPTALEDRLHRWDLA